MDIDPEQSLVFTGSAEGELKAWRIDHAALSDGLKENEKGEVSDFARMDLLTILTLLQLSKMITFAENIPLSTSHRVSQLAFHPNLPFLAAQTHDKSIDIFRIRTSEEVRRKQARRKRRAKEKSNNKSESMAKGEAETTQEKMDIDEDREVGITDLFTPYLVVRTSGKIRSFAFNSNELKTSEVAQVSTCHPVI
jgi:U3 small nucleolar RNA-associated protein 12